MTTDATKLPEPIEMIAGPGWPLAYRQRGRTSTIEEREWTSAQLRAIAAHMDAQAGRTVRSEHPRQHVQRGAQRRAGIPVSADVLSLAG